MKPPDAEHYLYLAAQRLSQPNLRLLAPRVGVGPPPISHASPRPPRTSAMMPLHDHPVPEFCLVLEGRAALDIGEQRWHMAPPMLAVLEPGARHAEGYARRDQPYALLWFTAFSTASVLVNISRYSAGGQWRIVHQLPLRTAAVRPIVRQFDGQQPIDVAALARLRADLLLLVSQLLRPRARRHKDKTAAVWERHVPVLWRVRELLDEQYAQPLRLEQIAAMTRLSPNYLSTIFRRWTGASVHSYLTARRMEKAMRLCRSSDLLIKEVARAVGYDDALYFSRAFTAYHGRTPTEAQASRARGKPRG